jgi:hypothetical protein
VFVDGCFQDVNDLSILGTTVDHGPSLNLIMQIGRDSDGKGFHLLHKKLQVDFGASLYQRKPLEDSGFSAYIASTQESKP